MKAFKSLLLLSPTLATTDSFGASDRLAITLPLCITEQSIQESIFKKKNSKSQHCPRILCSHMTGLTICIHFHSKARGISPSPHPMPRS